MTDAGLSTSEQGGPVYEVGDKVVYPHHGAGVVQKKEMKEVLGQHREYLTIQILYNDMTVMVPAENAERAGVTPATSSCILAERATGAPPGVDA